KPCRRAVLWDGVVPLKRGLSGGEMMNPDDLREIVNYVQEFREVGANSDGQGATFDVVVAGHTSGEDLDKDRELIKSYADVGATWWFEDIGPWSLPGWNWGEPWPL